MGNKVNYNNGQNKFEFTLYLNDNIVVQRFFNVIGFNSVALNSIDFKEAVDYNLNLIQDYLKNETLDYLNEVAYQFYENPNFEENDSADVLKLVVKMGGKIIAYREWDATIYPVKVRHTIDVRGHIYEMITKIQKCLSRKTETLETTYMGYNLIV